MKVIEAEIPSAAGPAADVPSQRLAGWRRAETGQEGAAGRSDADAGDAPPGWWLVPALIGGLLAWVWLVRGLVGWTANLL